MWWRRWRAWWRRRHPLAQARWEQRPTPPSLEQIAEEMRRLDRQRRATPSPQSQRWLAEVTRAYDARLRLVCSRLGVEEYLEPLIGMDRELERVRVEGILQDATLFDDAASVATIEKHPSAAESAPHPRDGHAKRAAAIWLVDVAVLLLPSVHRARYREEFQGELHELAAAGATGKEQLFYGVRLIGQAWALRGEILPPEEPPG